MSQRRCRSISALLASFGLFGFPTIITRELKRLGEHRLIIPAVVDVSCWHDIRKLVRKDQVVAAQLDGIETEVICRRIHKPLHHEVCDFRAEPAIGSLLTLVGHHGNEPHAEAADPVWTGDLRQGVPVRSNSVLKIRTVVVDDCKPKGQHGPILPERQFSIIDAVTAVGVGVQNIV